MKKKDLGILLAVCFIVFGLPFTALAEEGVTDTTIRIGQWGPQTGPAAPWGCCGSRNRSLFSNDQ